jgi:hypothetical protein
MTMGIVPVACFAAWIAGGEYVTMTLTFRRTSSAARPGSRSYFPSAPPGFNRDVLAFHKAQLAQALLEGSEAKPIPGAIRIAWRQKAYSEDLPRLGLGGERRGKQNGTRASKERATVYHSITSSARPSSDGGIVRPRALAVLRLMTSSNFVGCSTGRSAGLAPFRILSTITAARRRRSTGLAP